MEKATGRNRAGHLPVFLEVLGCHQRNLRVLISGFLFKKKFFFFKIFGCAGSLLWHNAGSSLVAASGGFPLQWLLLLRSTGSSM